MRHFIRHYVEMVIAMLVGMFVLGGAVVALLAALGVDVGELYDDAPPVVVLGMALSMTVPMVAWMRHRGHGWAPAREMAAAMFVPAIAAIVLYWAGTIDDTDTLMAIEHVAMFPAMLAVMLLRRSEYARAI
jgi:hypothetical protein